MRGKSDCRRKSVTTGYKEMEVNNINFVLMLLVVVVKTTMMIMIVKLHKDIEQKKKLESISPSLTWGDILMRSTCLFTRHTSCVRDSYWKSNSNVPEEKQFPSELCKSSPFFLRLMGNWARTRGLDARKDEDEKEEVSHSFSKYLRMVMFNTADKMSLTVVPGNFFLICFTLASGILSANEQVLSGPWGSEWSILSGLGVSPGKCGSKTPCTTPRTNTHTLSTGEMAQLDGAALDLVGFAFLAVESVYPSSKIDNNTYKQHNTQETH
jgi:hypothetical protein